MSSRQIPLVIDEIYHIFNRSIAKQQIFSGTKEKDLLVDLIEYYHFKNTSFRFSFYSRLEKGVKQDVIKSLYKENKLFVDILAFTIMPNHFHILAKQVSEHGISDFMRYLQNSFAKYLNTKTKRTGGLFQSPFKAVRIEDEKQLLHVSRYIHLNPLTSYVLKDRNDLTNYRWSSFVDYVTNNPRQFVNTNMIRSYFKKEGSFEEFTLNNLDYQRQLDSIKHLIFE